MNTNPSLLSAYFRGGLFVEAFAPESESVALRGMLDPRDPHALRGTMRGVRPLCLTLVGADGRSLVRSLRSLYCSRLQLSFNVMATSRSTRTRIAMKPDSTHPNASAFPDGLSGPALRALAHAGIRSMAQLAQRTEREIAALHGMGPKGVRLLQQGLATSGRHFRRVPDASAP